jgi:hypothetical protein
MTGNKQLPPDDPWAPGVRAADVPIYRPAEKPAKTSKVAIPASTLTKALRLAGLGLPVFPCAPTKQPTCAHGFKDASCDPAAVRVLWRDHPGPLIGVPTGAASGIFVLDVDGPRHPEAEEWLERHAPYLPETRHHRTQSGGLHFLFKHRDGLRNTASRLAPGIDTRGEGGYMIWWPAAIEHGHHLAPLADLDDWLVEALAPPPPRRISPPPSGANVSDITAMPRVRGLIAVVATARQGERNALTFWGACTIRDMLNAGELDRTAGEHAVAALFEAGRHCGLSDCEIKSTLASATRAR